MNSYACSICGKEHVKLWRPYGGTEPLICATCAEERQTPQEYRECIWGKLPDGNYKGTFTGNMIPMERWKVNEDGQIPSCSGPGPDGKTFQMTDQLKVNLKDVSKIYKSGHTNMIPAVPDAGGDFWCYSAVPDKFCKWWYNLPTR